MKTEEKAEIKKAIEDKIKLLTEDVEILKDHMQPVTLKCVVDKANKMDAISNNAVKDAVLRTSLEKLNVLKVLSNKIDDPDFGMCRRCGKSINPQRLKYLPESTLCIHCAGK